MAEGLAEKGNNFNCRECRYGSECNTANAHGYKVGFCSQYIQKAKAQTNADRIRNMTDEELAEWFCTMCNFGDFCHYKDDCDTNGFGVLKWLKEEVKDE